MRRYMRAIRAGSDVIYVTLITQPTGENVLVKWMGEVWSIKTRELIAL